MLKAISRQLIFTLIGALFVPAAQAQAANALSSTWSTSDSDNTRIDASRLATCLGTTV